MTNFTNGKATTTKKIFSRTTCVAIHIQAAPALVWQLLTDAASLADWNSTIISIEGRIQQGERILLKTSLAPERTFKLKIKEIVPNQKMVWGDAMGTRTYTLTAAQGGTHFQMTETIGGPIFPLFAKHIPPFDAAFEQVAADLKQAAERQA